MMIQTFPEKFLPETIFVPWPGDLEERNYRKTKLMITSGLKVGHHGSKGSLSDVFLDQLHPQLAFDLLLERKIATSILTKNVDV